MTNKDRISDFVRLHPGCNDDQIAKTLQIAPRQTVNQVCRALARDGYISRRPGASGKLENYPRNWNGIQADYAAGPLVSKVATSLATVPSDWFWEGNVVDALASHLQSNGWEITSQADTGSKQRGTDLVACKQGKVLLIEAKGYPSVTYRDPGRAGETKPTSPSSQAQQWYSHALLKALRLQGAHPTDQIAIALPSFPRYRALVRETRGGLTRLGISVMFVDELGSVELVV